MAAAAVIRCRWCGMMVIELAAAPWRYKCRACKGRESSTGIISPPDRKPYADGWQNRYRSSN